jgi:hypothetical protein
LDVDKEFADPEYRINDSGLIWQAESFVGSLSSATAPDGADGKPNFWRHHERPLRLAKENAVPPLNREMIEAAVGDYLQMPVRSAYVDRLLVDLLVAMELFAFARDAFGHGFERSIRFAPSALLSFLKGAAISLLIFGVLLGALWSLSGYIASGWTEGLAFGIVLLASIDLAWMILMLPWSILARRRHNKRISAMLATMHRVYLKLEAAGPVSSRNFIELARKATDAGVAWPAPLFALLDDIAARSGRF